MAFTDTFLQGVNQGRAAAAAKQQHEQDLEELDLKKKMLKIEMDKLKVSEQVREREFAAKAREGAFQEAANMKNFDLPPEVSGTGQIAATGARVPQIDLKAAAPAAAPVAIPAGGYGEAPTTVMAPTRTGTLQGLIEQEKQKRALEAEALKNRPQTPQEIATLAQQEKNSVRQAEIAQRGQAITMRGQDIAAQTARMKNGESGFIDPQDAEFVADQILKRKMTMREVYKDQRKEVEAAIRKRGLDVPRPLTAQELNAQTQASSGLAAVDNLELMLKKDPNLIEKDVAPGILGRLVPGVSEYRTYRSEMVDVLARIRTGAAISKYEEDFYKGQAPALGDPPAAVQTKLNQFRGLYLASSGLPVTLVDPNGKREAIIQDGYDPKQRIELRKLIAAGWTPEY